MKVLMLNQHEAFSSVQINQVKNAIQYRFSNDVILNESDKFDMDSGYHYYIELDLYNDSFVDICSVGDNLIESGVIVDYGIW